MNIRKKKTVSIYGAGLSGLVAAINLAENDFEVHVYDQYDRIGGNPAWHPSIQTTVLNPEKTWDYIGMNLSQCFNKVESVRFYRYGKKKDFTLDNLYVCERGPRYNSLEYTLFKNAQKIGVKFYFKKTFDTLKILEGENIIISTGLSLKVYSLLNIPFINIYGYRGVLNEKFDRILITYMLKCTNYDFAYLASDHGLLFALLFSRKRLDENNLNEFKKVLKETEDIHIKKWIYSVGALPVNKQLIHNGLILSGTLSGMIDPFVLHGISGALTSGKIAALYLTDRDKALDEFKILSSRYKIKKALKAISFRLPLKSYTIPIMMFVDAHLKGVGFVK
jgi:flavin-dependent dehydrogenase